MGRRDSLARLPSFPEISPHKIWAKVLLRRIERAFRPRELPDGERALEPISSSPQLQVRASNERAPRRGTIAVLGGCKALGRLFRGGFAALGRARSVRLQPREERLLVPRVERRDLRRYERVQRGHQIGLEHLLHQNGDRLAAPHRLDVLEAHHAKRRVVLGRLPMTTSTASLEDRFDFTGKSRLGRAASEPRGRGLVRGGDLVRQAFASPHFGCVSPFRVLFAAERGSHEGRYQTEGNSELHPASIITFASFVECVFRFHFRFGRARGRRESPSRNFSDEPSL